MKAHLFATSLLGLTAHAAVHHDIAGLAARQAFPSDAAVSVCYTYTSTYLTLVTPTTSGGAATPTPPAFFPVILGIEPLGVAKRDLEKRAGLGGFVTNDPANPNALNCSAATIFQLQIGGGVFLDTGIPLFTTSGSAFQEFRATGPSPAGAITTTFTGQDGSILTWANSAFFGGAATFCQVPATGQVYSTFQGTANVPAGCVTVQLRIYAATRCNNGVIDGGASSSASSTTTTEGLPTSSPATTTDSTPSTVTDSTSSTVTDSTSSTVTDSTSSTVTDSTSSTVTDSTSSTVTDSTSSTVTDSTSSTVTDSTSSTVTDSTSSTVTDSTSSTVTDSTSSTVTETVSSTTITDNGSTTPPVITPTTSSSASQITITSTSTETTFVVTSTTSSSAFGPTSAAAACAFGTSGSIILNGGFENPSANPFAFAPEGILPIPLTKKRGTQDERAIVLPDLVQVSTLTIVPSAGVPEPFNDLCQFVLEIAFAATGVQVIDVYGTSLNTAPNQLYSISFDVLACGPSGSVYVTIDDFTSQTFGSQDCATPGSGAAWQTVTGTFTSNALLSGILDIVYIHATGGLDASQAYFDNFIVRAIS